MVDENNNQGPAPTGQPNNNQPNMAGGVGNPLAQPVQRQQPVPPPPPLGSKVNKTSGAEDSVDANLPQSFAMPSEEEIRKEQQRQRIAEKSKIDIPVAPATAAPAPVPVTAPTPVPAPMPAAPTSAPQPILNKPFAREPKPADITPPTKLVPPGTAPQPERLQAQTITPPPTMMPGATVPPAVAAATPPPPSDANKPDIFLGEESRGSGKRWLWPAVAGVVVTMFGVVWFLQSAGIIYAGWLAGMAGGLPRDPAKALTVIQNKANVFGNYKYSASMAVSFSSIIPDLGADSAGLIPDASGTITGQVDGNTVRSDYDFILGSEYPVSTLNGVSVIDKEKGIFFVDTLSLLEPDNNWRRIPRAELEQYTLLLPLLQLNVADLMTKANGGEFIGKSNLGDNQAALTYVYDLAPIIDSTDADIQEGRLTLWVSKKDGRILIAQADTLISTDIGIVLLQLQLTLGDHGVAKLIPVDTEAVVEDAKVTDIYQGLGVIPTEVVVAPPITEPVPGGGAAPTNLNDARRVADLNSIAAALEAYKGVFGLYPISREVSKSSTSGNILSKNLVEEGFLTTLPQDPAGGSYYYGYKSDGQNYTLTSILEDANFEGAKQGNGFYYQELTN